MSTRKQIVGNMTADPEFAFSQHNKAWARFRVASTEGKDDSKRTCYTACKAFGEMAENIAESLTKGMRVIVSGREQTEEWETNGEKRSANVLIVDSIGPDLRYATAKVTRNSKPTPSNSKSWSNEPANGPWASAPDPVEPAPW